MTLSSLEAVFERVYTYSFPVVGCRNLQEQLVETASSPAD